MKNESKRNVEPLALIRHMLKGIVAERDIRLARGRGQTGAETPHFIRVDVFSLKPWPSAADVAAGQEKQARVRARLDRARVAYGASCGTVIILNEGLDREIDEIGIFTDHEQ